MFVYVDDEGECCFKSGDHNAFVYHYSREIRRGGIEWQDFFDHKEYQRKDLKWAKLHGLWQVALELDTNKIIDYEYYGVK